MTSVRVGAALTGLPGPRYFARLGLLELHPPISPPKAATLARWRESIPTTCEVAVAIPRRLHASKQGALRFEKPAARPWLDDSVRLLQPRFVVLFTGPEFSTGSRDRALLEQLVNEVQALGPKLVWQPRGLWEAQDASELAKRIGCEVALDLLAQGFEGTADTLAYGRVEALGTHARLGDGHLRRALDELLALGADEARLIVESEDGIRKAHRLAELLEGLAEEGSGQASPRRRDAVVSEGDEGEFEDDEDDDDDLDGDDEDDGEDDLDDGEDDLDGDDEDE